VTAECIVAEAERTVVAGRCTVAEGWCTVAEGWCTVAEGWCTVAEGWCTVGTVELLVYSDRWRWQTCSPSFRGCPGAWMLCPPS
jgi:hypothetical protein